MPQRPEAPYKTDAVVGETYHQGCTSVHTYTYAFRRGDMELKKLIVNLQGHKTTVLKVLSWFHK